MKQAVCFLSFLPVAILIILTGCSKGSTGPAGAQGPAGQQGAAGPAGPAGTANVTYSDWNYATNFRDTTIDGSLLNVADLAAPSITANDLDSATFAVYFTFGSGIFPLPYTSDAGGKANTMSFLPEVGKMLITRFTADNSASVHLSVILQYRFIIIPGGVHVPNNMDYQEMSEYFQIP
jgi:hypothetical protein